MVQNTPQGYGMKVMPWGAQPGKEDRMASVPRLDRTAIGPTGRPRSTSRTDLVTILLGMWVVLGLVAGGNTHLNTPHRETFFTPSHAVLYSGYLSAAGWMGWQVLQQRRRGHQGLAAVPVGYGLGLVGAVLFGLGGLADLAWHALFGIETDIDALLSPSHLVLFFGAALILTTPWRAAASAAEEAPGFRAFLPVLVSATATVMFVAFFVLYLSPFTAAASTMARAAGLVTHQQQVLFWSRGIAGLLADLLINRLRPSTTRPLALWTVAAAVPAAVWDPTSPSSPVGTALHGRRSCGRAAWCCPASPVWPSGCWPPHPGSTATSPNGQPEVDATAPTPTALTDLERRRLSW